MKSERQEPPDASASAASQAFTPCCPQCRYDLTGVPDGACPECGTAFSIDALFAEHVAARSNRSIAMSVLAPCAWMVFLLAVACAGGAGEDLRGGRSALWFLAASILFVFREFLFASRVLTTVVLGIGIVALAGSSVGSPWRVVWSSWWPWTPWHYAVLSIILCFPALIVGRWRWMLWAWGSIMLGSGAVVILTALDGIVQGQHWSPWSDPRWWDPYRQYPLSHHEAVWFGLACCLPGVLLLLVVRRIDFASRTSKP